MNLIKQTLKLETSDNNDYDFKGSWEESEKKVIQDVLNKYIPNGINSMFNNWVLSKHCGMFYAFRKTWTSRGFRENKVSELATKIEKYYTH